MRPLRRLLDEEPVTTIRAPGRRSADSSRMVSIDSCRAASMNAQVFTTTRSASWTSRVGVSPSASKVPASLCESTSFLGQPRVSM